MPIIEKIIPGELTIEKLENALTELRYEYRHFKTEQRFICLKSKVYSSGLPQLGTLRKLKSSIGILPIIPTTFKGKIDSIMIVYDNLKEEVFFQLSNINHHTNYLEFTCDDSLYHINIIKVWNILITM